MRPRRNVGAAMRTVLEGEAMTETPPSAPRSGARPVTDPPHVTPSNPIAGAIFRALRDLRADFGRGGLPSRDQRTPEDEARITAFCVLQELVHILDQFRRAIEQGVHCRLVVSEHGRQLGKVVIEITIEDV